MKKLEMSAFNGFAITPKFVFGGIASSGGAMGTAEGPAEFKVIWRGCIGGYCCIDIENEDGSHSCGVRTKNGYGGDCCD